MNKQYRVQEAFLLDTVLADLELLLSLKLIQGRNKLVYGLCMFLNKRKELGGICSESEYRLAEEYETARAFYVHYIHLQKTNP